MHKKHHVQLTSEQREHLESLLRTGSAAARTYTHARILLKADRGDHGLAWSDRAIAEACDVSRPTVERVRRTFATQGLTAALYRKRPTGVSRRKLDGKQEAHLIALACSVPPNGAERWTLTLLAERLVELEIVESIARDTVRLALKKMNLSLG